MLSPPSAVTKQNGVAAGLGVPRSAKTIVISLGSAGLTTMLPEAFQRIWWPQIVWREITDQGMSLSPSSSCTAGTGSLQVAPPSVDLTTMIWASKSNGTSQESSFW